MGKNYCFATTETILEESGLDIDESTFSRALKCLEDKGFLYRVTTSIPTGGTNRRIYDTYNPALDTVFNGVPGVIDRQPVLLHTPVRVKKSSQSKTDYAKTHTLELADLPTLELAKTAGGSNNRTVNITLENNTLLSKTSLDDAAAEPLVEPRHLVSAREKKATVPAQPKLFDLETEHPPEPKRKVALKEKGAAGDLRPSDGVSGSNVGQGQSKVTTAKETGKSGPTETNIKDSFAEFWKRYDLVTGKKDAEKAWAKIMKAAKADWKQVATDICLAATAHKDKHQDKNRKEGQANRNAYRPMASTWLNGERYNDDLSTVVPIVKPNTIQQAPPRPSGFTLNPKNPLDD